MAATHGSTARERAEQAAQHVLRVWESGELPSLIAKSYLSAKSDAPCSKWSLGNRLLMIVQGTNDARGFNQWKDAGRHVAKGAKAIWILGPCIVKREDSEGNESSALVGFRGIPVFRFEDTEGEPLETSEYRPDDLPPLQEVAARIGVKVSYCPLLGDFLGRYMPGRKAIELCTHEASTWFHELSHAVDDYLGSMKRAKSRNDAAYRDGEVVAEFCAAALSSLYGMAYEGNALQYIAGYRDNPAKAVTRLLARIEAVLTFILSSESSEATEAQPVAIAA